MSGKRLLGLVLVLLVGGLVAAYATLRAGWWNPTPATARLREASPPSRFITVDGVPLHVRDEGRGPVLILLHGSIVNLHEWDLVALRLEDRYRVVRLDWPPYGLSGPDPSGVYTTARAAELLAGLVAALHLERFTLVATSNGGNVALEYAAHHPEHVEAMAFSILPLERPSQTRHVDASMRLLLAAHAALLPDYHFPFFYRMILTGTTPPSFHPSDAMVDSIYEADSLPGAAARQRQYIESTVRAFQTSDVGAIAGAIRVPVLLQWCGYDTVISQSAARTVARFTHAPVTLIEYPDLGHFPMWEDPDRFSSDLAHWLEGLPRG